MVWDGNFLNLDFDEVKFLFEVGWLSEYGDVVSLSFSYCFFYCFCFWCGGELRGCCWELEGCCLCDCDNVIFFGFFCDLVWLF